MVTAEAFEDYKSMLDTFWQTPQGSLREGPERVSAKHAHLQGLTRTTLAAIDQVGTHRHHHRAQLAAARQALDGLSNTMMQAERYLQLLQGDEPTRAPN